MLQSVGSQRVSRNWATEQQEKDIVNLKITMNQFNIIKIYTIFTQQRIHILFKFP